MPSPIPRRIIPAMNDGLWAIIGVAVGAIIPGGIGLTQAILQRKWSTADAETAWEQEKRDRLFEAKRSAHEAFTESLHRARGVVLDSRQRDMPSPESHPDFGPAMNEIMHRQAQLQVYASLEATDAAVNAASALTGLDGPVNPESDDDDPGDSYHRARVIYLYVARGDMGIEDSPLTPEFIKSLRSADAEPEE